MHKGNDGIAVGRANLTFYSVDGLICDYKNSDRLVVASSISEIL